MKEYNIKRHYYTKHAAKFDGIEDRLRFDETEQFKKSLKVQEVFYAYEKDISLLENWAFRYLR